MTAIQTGDVNILPSLVQTVVTIDSTQTSSPDQIAMEILDPSNFELIDGGKIGLVVSVMEGQEETCAIDSFGTPRAASRWALTLMS